MSKTTTKPNLSDQGLEKLAEAPAEAFLLRQAGELQLAAADGAKGNYDDPRPIELLARSFGPADHPWWFGGKVYHDFDGMRMHKPRLMVDYNHEDPIGYCESPEVIDGQGLKLGGAIVPAGGDDDPARVVLKRGDAGVPYEASIDFYGPMSVEYVDAELSAEVNGETVEGPCSIVREWTLRGVAVAPYGADMQAETQFASRGAVRLSVLGEKENDGGMMTAGGESARMGKSTESGDAATTDSTTDAPETEGTVETPTTETETVTETPADSGDAAAEFTAKLDKYTSRFGPVKGVELFKAGTDYVEALEASHTELGQELAVANQKLSGLKGAEETGLGEDEPKGQFGAAGGPTKKKGLEAKLKMPK